MIFKPRPRAALSVAWVVLAISGYPNEAWSCVCCSEPGERRTESVVVDEYVGSQLKEITVSGAATLFTNACYFECVKGLSDPSESYSVALSKDQDRWTFTFRDTGGGGGTGTLSFDPPGSLFAFAVDPTPGQSKGSPNLYKEWRITAPVAGTGIFEAGMRKNPTATLVLHGQGSSCDQAYDFTHWSLIVSGPYAEFTFYGPLRRH